MFLEQWQQRASLTPGVNFIAFPGILKKTLIRKIRDPSKLSIQLLIIATEARKKGVLALSAIESKFNVDPFLSKSVQMVTDGFGADEIEEVLDQEMASLTKTP